MLQLEQHGSLQLRTKRVGSALNGLPPLIGRIERAAANRAKYVGMHSQTTTAVRIPPGLASPVRGSEWREEDSEALLLDRGKQDVVQDGPLHARHVDRPQLRQHLHSRNRQTGPRWYIRWRG